MIKRVKQLIIIATTLAINFMVNVQNVTAEELSFDEFLQEFYVRYNTFVSTQQAKDEAQFYEFLAENPGTVQDLLLILDELSQDNEENAKLFQEIASMLRESLQTMSEIASMTTINWDLQPLLTKGNQAYDVGDYQVALEKWEAGLEQARTLNDKKYISDFLGNIGRGLRALKQPYDALHFYEEALVIDRQLGEREDEGSCLGNIGNVYYDLGEYQKALYYHRQALTIHRELDDLREEGKDLMKIGTAYNGLGQYQEALYHHEQALGIFRVLGASEKELIILFLIAEMCNKQGQYQKSMYCFERALDISRALNLRQSESRALNGLGVVFHQLGQYQKAIHYYKETLTINRELERQIDYWTVLSNLSQVYVELGLYQEAIYYFEQTLEIASENNDHNLKILALNGMGMAYIQIGRTQDALRMHEQALAASREIGDNHLEAICLGNIGVEYRSLKQFQKARTFFQGSLTIHANQGNLDLWWKAQSGLASVEVKLNHSETAIMLYEQALDSIETMRGEVSEKELKLSFMQDKLFVYDEFIDLLRDLHEKYPHKGYDRKALEIFERKQGRVFLEEMGKSGARLFSGLPEEMSQKELDLALQTEQTRKQLVSERSKPFADQNKELIHTLEGRETTLQTEQTALQEEMKTHYPDYYALKYPTPVSLEELKQEVLSSEELLFVYHVMEEKTLLWTISPETMHMFTIPAGEEDLQQQIEALRYAMEIEGKAAAKAERGSRRRASAQDVPLSFAEASHALYKLLIPETARFFLRKERSLHIVPTGPLYELPFEALVTEKPTPGPSQEGNLHYLIETLPVSYLSSASLLKTIRESQTRRKISEQDPLLAFANPVYDSSSSSANNVQNAERDAVDAQNSLLAMTDLSDEASGSFSFQALREQRYRDLIGGRFPELPETEEEVQTIAKLLKVPDSHEALQLGGNASKANIFALNAAEQLDDYQYLVFAAHGVLPGKVDRITQPALVLSHPERDGYLTMAEVFQLQLNARLVVLSACNTGRGEQVRGEGVMGLTRAFMYAGTPAVAVTLWSVDSLSAKDLDIGMFEHLKEGQTPVQALRSIKLRMIRGEEGETYQHPYYWASFVLFGDGSGTTH